MKIAGVAKQFQHLMIASILLGMYPASALAQTGHSHDTTAELQPLTQSQSTLSMIVRENTERFKDVRSPRRKDTPSYSAASRGQMPGRWGSTS